MGSQDISQDVGRRNDPDDQIRVCGVCAIFAHSTLKEVNFRLIYHVRTAKSEH